MSLLLRDIDYLQVPIFWGKGPARTRNPEKHTRKAARTFRFILDSNDRSKQRRATGVNFGISAFAASAGLPCYAPAAWLLDDLFPFNIGASEFLTTFDLEVGEAVSILIEYHNPRGTRARHSAKFRLVSCDEGHAPRCGVAALLQLEDM